MSRQMAMTLSLLACLACLAAAVLALPHPDLFSQSIHAVTLPPTWLASQVASVLHSIGKVF